MKVGTTLLAAAGALLLGATSASAAIVCNNEGDCWRVKSRPHYKPGLGLRIYSDNWKWKKGARYRWRDARNDRGYWRRGVWVNID